MKKLTTTRTATRNLETAYQATTKLTNAQRTFLSLAALREDGAGDLPEGTTDNAGRKLAAALIDKGLVREVRAKAEMPAWRRDEEGRAFALIITKLGKAAIAAQVDRQLADMASNAPALSTDAGPSRGAAVSARAARSERAARGH